MYDAVVIGAGPAGCTAAKVLADRGARVVLAERHKLPRYKSCSGMLIRKTLRLTEEYFGEKVPASVCCEPTENKGMVFTDDKGKEYRFEQEGLNVWRSGFDGWLAEKAAESGAKLLDGCGAVSVSDEGGCVKVGLKNGKTLTAGFALICEGAAGQLKSAIIGKKPEYVTTFQTFNKGSIELDHHYFYAYLQPELSEYDAWFNVKDNLLVLGVSVMDREKIPFYYREFISYMEKCHKLKIFEQIKEEKWVMPLITPDFEVCRGVGRILFCGESAGWLNPMGEGISAAMESGCAAAVSVSENPNAPMEVLERYKELTEGVTDYMKRQWRFTGRLAGGFDRFCSDRIDKIGKIL